MDKNGLIDNLSVTVPVYLLNALNDEAKANNENLADTVQRIFEKHYKKEKWRSETIDNIQAILTKENLPFTRDCLDQKTDADDIYLNKIYLKPSEPFKLSPIVAGIEIVRVQYRVVLKLTSTAKKKRISFENFYNKYEHLFSKRNICLYEYNRYVFIGYVKNVLNIDNIPDAHELVDDLLFIYKKYTKFEETLID